MHNTLRFSILTFFVLVFSHIALAQSTAISPYSRYGIGDLNAASLPQNFALGGAGIAVADPNAVNILNPALPVMLNKPFFDLAAKSSFLQISNANSTQKVNSTSINHFVYAFPVIKKWTITAGLIPFSKVGYTIRDSQKVNDSTTANLEYIGSGGLNRAFIGNALQLYNHKDSTILALGVNVNYIFGSLQTQRRALYSASQGFYNTRSLSSTNMRDFSFDLGTYYSFYPNKAKSLKLSVGATYGLASSLRARQETLAQSFITGVSGLEFPKDTIDYVNDQNGKVTLPQSIGIGVSVVLKDKLTIGLDYSLQNWSSFSQTVNNVEFKDDLSDASRLSLGVQYTPQQIQLYKTSFLKLISYRVGFRTEQTYLQLKNTQLNSTAYTVGLSIPLRKSNSLSKLNIGYEYLVRGTTQNNLLKEQYSNLMIGLSLSPSNLDRWFYKRKYD